MIEEVIQKWKKSGKSDIKKYVSFFSKLSKNGKNNTSAQIELHKEAFSKLSCLSCANCCKTTPAIMEMDDIVRISKSLQISKNEFIKKYILEDINGELSLNKVPCHFLRDDNSCSIYEVRPQACRQFPHTDDSSYFKRPHLNARNVLVCPAAYYIAEEWQKRVDVM